MSSGHVCFEAREALALGKDPLRVTLEELGHIFLTIFNVLQIHCEWHGGLVCTPITILVQYALSSLFPQVSLFSFHSVRSQLCDGLVQRPGLWSSSCKQQQW